MPPSAPIDDSPYLIVGLGNPGPKYARTRHNIGFMVAEELARRHGMRFAGGQANSEVARGSIGTTKVVLAKPQTYMNNSGQAVQSLSHFYKIPSQRVIVIYDDFALPMGTIRMREKGSSGGHNGMESIIRHLRTQAFPRLRIGVDKPPGSHINWVLGRFTKEEEPLLAEVIARSADAIEAIFTIGIERAMNRYNTASRDEGRKTKDKGEEKEGSGVGGQGSGIPRATSHQPLATDNPSSVVRRPSSVFDRVRRMIRGEEETE
jgi:PTH1 family peptidyl-tRNA hydrolase